MNEISKLPQRIKELRTREKMTQGEFAKKLGLTPATVSAYENEEHTKTPSLKVLINIANTFNVSLDWLCSRNKIDGTVYNTYRQAIGAIIALSNSFSTDIRTNTRETDSDYANSPTVFSSEFSIDDELLYQFFDAWGKIYGLFKDGTIDYSLYSLWLKNEMNNPAYDSTPPLSIDPPPEENYNENSF